MNIFKRVREFFRRLRNKEEPVKQREDTIDVYIPDKAGIGKFTPPPSANVPPFPEITVPQTPTPAGWPEGTYEFAPYVYYVPYRGSNGGPFTKPEQAYEWMRRIDQWFLNIDNANKAIDEKWYIGMYPAGEVDNADAMFLYAANRVFQSGFGSARGNLFYDFSILQGSGPTIAEVINRGERLMLQAQVPAETIVKAYNGKFYAIVNQVFKQYNV